jgi:hypothetical protein
LALDTDTLFGSGDHVVHFYDGSDALVDVVVPFLAPALADSSSIVVLATEAHREQLAAGLARYGIDVDAARAAGRVSLLDADEALARVMVDGVPDPAAFDAVVGAAMREAAAGGGRVRAFGELVALLWEAGDVTGALEVERLWDSLAETMPFSLFCAYPSELVADVLGERHRFPLAGLLCILSALALLVARLRPPPRQPNASEAGPTRSEH